MKRIAMVGLFLFLAACSTAQQQAATGNLAKLQQIVVNGCMVVQPTLQAVAAVDPVVMAAATANGLACTAASSITPTSVQTIITTGLPAIEAAVTASTLIPSNDKPIIAAALGIFEMTLQNALMVFGQPIAAPAPASSTTPASAPVGASS